MQTPSSRPPGATLPIAGWVACSLKRLLMNCITESDHLPVIQEAFNDTDVLNYMEPTTDTDETLQIMVGRAVRYYNSQRSQYNALIHDVIYPN